MLFQDLVDAYDEIEARSSRLEMTEILANLLKKADAADLKKIVYLTQGQLYPDFDPRKLGLADKLLLKTLAMSAGMSEDKIQAIWLKEGDPGLVAQIIFQTKKQQTLFSDNLSVARVYSNLEKIAGAEGSGSQETKMKLVADLLNDATPNEAKFICRIVTGRMRLGIAGMTMIDALAQAFATKEDRDEIERAFNVSSDMGKVAEVLATNGMEAIRKMQVEVFSPLRAMLAERLPSPEEILTKMDGKAAFEYKYDGLRVQAHIKDGKIKLFSRRLEELTEQFPDVAKALLKAFKAKSIIAEGECVPVDINTGEMLPFQEVSHRRGRKHGLEEAIEDYPVRVFLFDCVLKDGEDLTNSPLPERRKALEKSFEKTDDVRFSEQRVLDDPAKAEEFFQEALTAGCEGLMAKAVGPESFYRAGSRGYLWIKYKKEYRSEMTDTVDLVVVGAFAGRGKRKGVYGALLMATFNPESEMFETCCKLGSGFDDATLAKLPEMLEKYRTKEKPQRVSSKMEADYWFEPGIVLEVLGAEITVSPIHTASYSKIRKDSGLAIRFPRFTGRFREEKGPRDATTTQELEHMYSKQLKKVEG
ncbi:MAG TPA: ATP-dependent DNA ligase [Methanomassiliicoccales archaeon]|nr:ATP-dependent DNA ligase [Methanomassiliicoccales archaeon]